ncbi:Rec8 like protein-domain-containing protein [Irpex rosettiformis]|uniref:Rec8 like protein-domain-containing protein n=1 Tax=Irpex rosettiformis TaxID=378272 RepID=A0ACB8UKF2_9APHY|nr:Rec8 like protein-domain-containing protein [Irpex rosettiformis]
MFWSTELLSRRDSGFGLAWLAATLGAKSSFSKLPKRSVMAANISQLCSLIAEPPEPLALRLSSNLMIGVTRVYKVKQEILLTDITTCFNMLKKAFQDVYVSNSANVQLQMAQPTVRPDAVTLATNPTAEFALEFDTLFADWDERTRGDEENDTNDDEDEFGVKKKGKKKSRAKASSISQVEHARADLHTLQEHTDFLLSSSFDASFGIDGFGGLIPSSSQLGGYMGFEDNFLEGLDIGDDIGAELAKELGDGWGMPVDLPGSDDQVNLDVLDVEMGPSMGINIDFERGDCMSETGAGQAAELDFSPTRKRLFSEVDNDMMQPDGSVVVPLSPFGSASQADGDYWGPESNLKKPRRVRLLLDARTELTNEELEKARTCYMEGQAELRREQAQRKVEKEGMKVLEEMVWGAPRGINAPALIQFWEEIFKLQVGARSAQPIGDLQVTRLRRHVVESGQENAPTPENGWDYGTLDDGMELDMGFGDADLRNVMGQEELDLNSRVRSSEEPGQARLGSSRPPSVLGSNFGLGTKLPQSESQVRNNMFPWDNAGGVSSSISGVAFGVGGSDRSSFPRADIRLRRGSSLPKGNIGGVPESPASFIPSGSHFDADAFELALPTQAEDVSRIETQGSNVSMLSLEKNSSNFLEYMKIQANALAAGTSSLKFGDVVPKDASTRHVAAAAFYHCLVLSTKDLISVQQGAPYGVLRLIVK